MSQPLRAAAGDNDQLLTPAQVCALFQISKVTLWRMVNRGDLPRPAYLRPRAPRWSRADIRAAREQAPRMTPTEAKAAHRASKLQAAEAVPNP
jgi:predicted DNA-binding transcriptional regulator AlpA